MVYAAGDGVLCAGLGAATLFMPGVMTRLNKDSFLLLSLKL